MMTRTTRLNKGAPYSLDAEPTHVVTFLHESTQWARYLTTTGAVMYVKPEHFRRDFSPILEA